jgi:hypothetical protein
MDEQAGPTGKYPEGKLTPDDDGELNIALSIYKNRVGIAFGVPIIWIAMKPQQAVDFAQGIIKRAREIAKRTGETLEIEI